MNNRDNTEDFPYIRVGCVLIIIVGLYTSSMNLTMLGLFSLIAAAIGIYLKDVIEW